MSSPPRPLGDTPDRDYHDTLTRFARFAEPELRAVLDRLTDPPVSRIVDAGCGGGLVTSWITRTASQASVTACDLSRAHCAATHANAPDAHVVQGDLTTPPFRPDSVDLVWTMNTINHMAQPPDTVRALSASLRPAGRLVLVQTSVLSDLVFAWDWRLERVTQEACYRYYREKYGLTAMDTTGGRNIIQWMITGGLTVQETRTVLIERTQPLGDADRAYLQHSVFDGYWGDKLEPYLAPDDWSALRALTDPTSPAYCLDRPDFHYAQTMTVVTGRR